MVIAATATFIALTCWWLTQDRSIPVFDAGDHLWEAFHFRQLIGSGDLLGPLNFVSVYPPLAKLVGTLATYVGGVNVASPIIGENIVFVPLLTLGCYQTGRLLFNSTAGMLAAVFVLGSPLLIVQFHVFMLDAPVTAAVAVAIWLILASEGFRRPGAAALAGAAVGLGLLVKVQFAYFVAGPILLALAGGAWRNWRSLGAFALAAFAIASPWYLDHISLLGEMTQIAGGESGINPDNLPPFLSLRELSWYGWSTLNSQLLVPLFVLVVAGAVWMLLAVRSHGEMRGPRLQLLGGAVIAWVFITLTPLHDIRYDMPLMPYLAVIGTGWISYLGRTARTLAISVLVIGVVANTLGATFGFGGPLRIPLAQPLPATEAASDRITFYTNEGFLVAGPKRDGEILGLLKAMRREGVRTVAVNAEESQVSDFSYEGLIALAYIANLKDLTTQGPDYLRSAAAVTLIHLPAGAQGHDCAKLSDGSGVAAVRFDPAAGRWTYYCPARSQFH